MVDRPRSDSSFYPPLQCGAGRTIPHYWKSIDVPTLAASALISVKDPLKETDKTFAFTEWVTKKDKRPCSIVLNHCFWWVNNPQPLLQKQTLNPEERQVTHAPQLCSEAARTMHLNLTKWAHSQNALLSNHEQQLMWFYLNFSCALRHQNYSWPSPKLDSNLMWKYHWKRGPCAKD